MITRNLGRTGIPLTVLGFGSTGLGNLYQAQTEAGAMATLEAAYAAGIRYFDTAPLYGFGLAEHRVGAGLRRLPDDVVVSTKAGWRLFPARGSGDTGSVSDALFQRAAPFRARIDYSYDGIMRSFEDSMQRLGTDRIDIILLHDCDRRNHCFLLAGRYTLLDQSSLDSFLPLCTERGIGIIIGGPYNSGILATGATPGARYDYAPAAPAILERTSAIEAVCARHGVPLRAAALQFPLTHPAIATVIPGARDPVEVDENLRLIAHPIPPALWTDLAASGLLRPDAVPAG